MPSRDTDESCFSSHLDDLIGELNRTIPKALKEFDADCIHDARVATRRLKAALDLLRPVLSDHHRGPFAKVLKKLRRRLGPLRDLDVMIEHLGELSSHSAHGAAADWLRGHLVRRRQEARENTSKKFAPADVLAKLGAWWPVRQEVAEAGEAVDSLLAESIHLQLDAFAERAEKIGTGGGEEPQDPHQLRIGGKLLRYTLELAKAQGHRLPAPILRAFKRMQESLGTWHDYVVLLECATQVALDESLAYHDAEMTRRVLDLSRLFLRRAMSELAKFSSIWKRRGGEVARTIRETFPLTRPVTAPPAITELRTGPDQSGSGETTAPAATAPDVASTA